MEAIHCSGCGRTMGWTPNRFPGYKYCSQVEAHMLPFNELEERNALVVEMHRAERYTKSEMARRAGVSRVRIHHIIDAWEDAETSL